MAKTTTSKRKDKKTTAMPLEQELAVSTARDLGNLSVPGRRRKDRHHTQEEEDVIDAKTSQRILSLARQQQDEVTGEESLDLVYEEEEEESEEESEEEYSEYSEYEIDEDEAVLDSFVPPGQLEPGQSLADLIMSKIEQKREPVVAPRSEAPEVPRPSIDPKVIEVYTKCGELLSRYKSGPLPKALKILPTLRTWPVLVMMTVPEKWTPHATYALTRIFASNLEPRRCQKFYKEVLLPKVREEIDDTKRVSVHTYNALKKAMYKPAAFFKGMLLPLCEGGCNLREATIFASVLSKISVPMLHSAAALLKLAEMPYSGPTSVFIRVLLDKKYALPYKVIDALVFHFMSFKTHTQLLPVLWHQSFLVFVQRYKQDLTPDQKDALLEVCRTQSHSQITPEIRREIVQSVARGEMMQDPAALQMEVDIV